MHHLESELRYRKNRNDLPLLSNIHWLQMFTSTMWERTNYVLREREENHRTFLEKVLSYDFKSLIRTIQKEILLSLSKNVYNCLVISYLHSLRFLWNIQIINNWLAKLTRILLINIVECMYRCVDGIIDGWLDDVFVSVLLHIKMTIKIKPIL